MKLRGSNRFDHLRKDHLPFSWFKSRHSISRSAFPTISTFHRCRWIMTDIADWLSCTRSDETRPIPSLSSNHCYTGFDSLLRVRWTARHVRPGDISLTEWGAMFTSVYWNFAGIADRWWDRWKLRWRGREGERRGFRRLYVDWFPSWITFTLWERRDISSRNNVTTLRPDDS